MKGKLTIITILGLAFIYAGCSKIKSTTSTVSDQQVTLQVAQNVVNILDGQYGIDFTGGGLLGASVKNAQGGKKVNDLNNGCALSQDTTINFSQTIDTVKVSIQGTFQFGVTCTNNNPQINSVANFTEGIITPSLNATSTVAENLNLALNLNGNDVSIVLGGTVNENNSIDYLTGSHKGTSKQTYDYTFHALTVDGTGDLVSGTANFTTTGSGVTGNWNYTGVLTITGPNEATITLDDKTFHVDLTTGVVTS